MEQETPKSIRILGILNQLGKTTIANIFYHYQKQYNDYMNPNLMKAHLHYQYKLQRVKKTYKGRTKHFWGNQSQIYEITKQGVYILNKWGLL